MMQQSRIDLEQIKVLPQEGLVWNSVHAELGRKDLVMSLKRPKKCKGSGEIALSLDARLDGRVEQWNYMMEQRS